jgi:hypothetical protein
MLTEHIEARIRADLEGTAPPTDTDAADRAIEAGMSAAQLSKLDMYFCLEQSSEGVLTLLTEQERDIAKQRANRAELSLAELTARSEQRQHAHHEIARSISDNRRRLVELGRKRVARSAALSEADLDALHQDVFAGVDPATFFAL